MKNNKRIGLALSGGGYRAAAYHLGTLRALHKLGVLDKVDVISSVSGGSIIAAYYMLHKDNFEAFENGFKKALSNGVILWPFINLVVVLIAILASSIIFSPWLLFVWGVILYFFHFQLLPISWIISCRYRKTFFGDTKLKDLPDCPTLVINSTDITSQHVFSFSKKRMYSYSYPKDGFNHEDFRISDAVMASSCVPFAFSPIRIKSKYMSATMNGIVPPLLIDGGVYDNQGAHNLTDKSSLYQCDDIIISDAGNDKITSKGIWNLVILLKRTSSLLMDRISKIQRQQYLYINTFKNKRFAYIHLMWDEKENFIGRFVDSVSNGLVEKEVLDYHHITDEDVKRLNVKDTYEETKSELVEKLLSEIGYEQLNAVRVSGNQYDIARKVGTNLTSLSKAKIDALSNHAEWMTIVQIKLYMPFLI